MLFLQGDLIRIKVLILIGPWIINSGILNTIIRCNSLVLIFESVDEISHCDYSIQVKASR